jgi:hypothetical protein
VNKILEEFFVKDVIAYLDDILIPPQTLKDNIELYTQSNREAFKAQSARQNTKMRIFCAHNPFSGIQNQLVLFGNKGGRCNDDKKVADAENNSRYAIAFGLHDFFQTIHKKL